MVVAAVPCAACRRCSACCRGLSRCCAWARRRAGRRSPAGLTAGSAALPPPAAMLHVIASTAAVQMHADACVPAHARARRTCRCIACRNVSLNLAGCSTMAATAASSASSCCATWPATARKEPAAAAAPAAPAPSAAAQSCAPSAASCCICSSNSRFTAGKGSLPAPPWPGEPAKEDMWQLSKPGSADAC